MNTVSVKALPDGMRRVTVHSKGERDMSADLSPDALQAIVDRAGNDEVRGALIIDPPPEPKPSSPPTRPKK